MKLTLSYDEVSTIVAALLTKVTTAESNALKCAKYGMDKDVEFWQAGRCCAEGRMTAPKLTPDAPATRRAFNRLAREKMKLRLLADIRMDLMVCELEGWDKLEYLDELLALVQELRKGGGGDG